MENKKLIYIADDDFSIREALKAFLESAGYEVEDFETGDSLLKAFEQKHADLVISDVMMPGSSGFMICRDIRGFSNVPIIMLTSRDSELDYQIAMELGSDDFFTKPASPMNIVSRVKAIFRRMEYERERYVSKEEPDGVVCTEEDKIFLSEMSHELRTPLMSIKSYAEGIKQGIMEAEGASDTILEATDRLTEIVDDIFNRFSTQKGE
ncbi:MAG: response regulator [Defluviitaleaceae bacterium]|nr:response regulator [Defluviitaleaceae bacterium]MCL2263908.1 response regulator [Defluviitaleaceae bacterium]